MAKRGERVVSVPHSMALKAAVYFAVREAGVSNSELARRMRLDEKEARRILDPHHPTKLPRIEAALAALVRHVKWSLLEFQRGRLPHRFHPWPLDSISNSEELLLAPT